MPCIKPNHPTHVWPTTGQVVVERCERICDYCEPDAVTGQRKFWKHGWQLRRHVYQAHQKKGMKIKLMDGWSGCKNGLLDWATHHDETDPGYVGNRAGKTRNSGVKARATGARSRTGVPASSNQESYDGTYAPLTGLMVGANPGPSMGFPSANLTAAPMQPMFQTAMPTFMSTRDLAQASAMPFVTSPSAPPPAVAPPACPMPVAALPATSPTVDLTLPSSVFQDMPGAQNPYSYYDGSFDTQQPDLGFYEDADYTGFDYGYMGSNLHPASPPPAVEQPTEKASSSPTPLTAELNEPSPAASSNHSKVSSPVLVAAELTETSPAANSKVSSPTSVAAELEEPASAAESVRSATSSPASVTAERATTPDDGTIDPALLPGAGPNDDRHFDEEFEALFGDMVDGNRGAGLEDNAEELDYSLGDGNPTFDELLAGDMGIEGDFANFEGGNFVDFEDGDMFGDLS